MMYSKENLVYDYEWPDLPVSQSTGLPSRRAFDPGNGVQVLFIINCFYESTGLPAVDTGRRLEELLYNKLPLEKMSEMRVFNWLRNVYLYHSDR